MNISRIGHSYVNSELGHTIDTYFPSDIRQPRRGCSTEKLGIMSDVLTEQSIEPLDKRSVSIEDAHLNLNLLSERSIVLKAVKLDGVFTLLPTVAWIDFWFNVEKMSPRFCWLSWTLGNFCTDYIHIQDPLETYQPNVSSAKWSTS